jgi:agmatine/peptidylarginine deiminase
VGSFRLAPEWARQEAVILVWPHTHSDWANASNDRQLITIDKTYIEMSRYISRGQKLILVTYDAEHKQHIQNALTLNNINQDNIVFVEIPTNDTWVRDYGPIIVEPDAIDTNHQAYLHANLQANLLDFTFNAWGNKYSYNLDNLFNQNLIQELAISIPNLEIDLVLEGGNLEINSQGELLSSSTCFKRKAADENTKLSTLERNFETWFCQKTQWIHDVTINGDDTDGHIDTLARFCSDDIIAYSAPGIKSDPNNNALHSLADQLKNLKRDAVNNFELVPLPLPEPIFHDGDQLPASYANFLITNNQVLVPVFNDKQDTIALKVIDDLFPTREIIDIDSTTLIQQYGGIHCASMHLPTCISYEDSF